MKKWMIGLALLLPVNAYAFCGFYVAGADTKLYNNATMVVMMRDGTKTVLSMQNNYQGPPENFAMVVPVPVVLQKENVKTLPRALFTRVDTLAAPRLVEYWEQDPCQQRIYEKERARMPMKSAAAPMMDSAKDEDLGVKIEAQFTVAEYEIVVLSAQDSSGLDKWLKREKYKIPDGAEPLLRPYVQAGMKFFVAKVDVKKVEFKDGQAMLSPLRFHYDSDTFNLPIRLGLVNSAGTQDLIVHILSPEKRYMAANYKNVTIPTNLNVANATRQAFGSFYAALFDETVKKNPGAVVTEYAWQATGCDPCPTPGLTEPEIMTLGADVLPDSTPKMGFVLTRLHARYGKTSLGEDLVFKEAAPIVGGREMMNDKGRLERGAIEDSYNNFQARYIIRHWWRGPIACEHPLRGVWGGPPNGRDPRPAPALNLAFAPRNAKLGTYVKQDIPEIKWKRPKPKEQTK